MEDPVSEDRLPVSPGHLPGEHPLRRDLNDEVHSRPFEPMVAPVRLSHLAVLTGEQTAGQERAHLARLCAHFKVPPPAAIATQVMIDMGGFALRWERHTEFSTYGFIHEGPFEEAFADPIIKRVPPDWLAAIPGALIVAIHVAVEGRGGPRYAAAEAGNLLGAVPGGNAPAGSLMSSGAAAAWTDFTIGPDGFSRILVQDYEMGPRRTGRLVRRLLELETYRMMALLAFPLARDAAPALTKVGEEISNITTALATGQDSRDDRALLDELTRLAAEVERIGARIAYRLGAARAYTALVAQRIEELRETRLEGLQTLGEFMNRRFAPAMRTCTSVQQRLDGLAARVARTSELLRTRVDVQLEAQNRDLLESMNRRAKMQLRLQETVEGLSVVAISYYAASLLGYAVKGLKSAYWPAAWPFSVEAVVGVAIPVILMLVWTGMRRMRRRLTQDVNETYR
jgi:uncharacterized membrane-anchored protein